MFIKDTVILLWMEVGEGTSGTLAPAGADHLKGLKYLPGVNDHEWEYRAIRAELNHWSWKGTSPQYKQASYSGFGKHLTPQEIKKYYTLYGIGK